MRNSEPAGIVRRDLVKSLLVAAVLGAATIMLWISMERSAVRQVARIAEAESYVARSQLVRNIDTVLAALRSVRTYWVAFGHLPQDQWATDAGIELEHLSGIDVILWDDPTGDARYMYTPDRPTFSYRPDENEWASYGELLETARNFKGAGIIGPMRKSGGDFQMIVIVSGRDLQSGRLVAIIDIDRMLDRFLHDESAGVAVEVFSGDELIYQRGSADPAAPEEWVRGGLIRSSFGTLWRVVHSPTTDMLEYYSAHGTPLILILGLLVAFLMGTLTFENGRARNRAKVAELAEARVSELNRNLEALVADRTKELSARTADLQTLTDSVAHDLRNPLNVLAVNIELLEDSIGPSADSQERRKILERLSPCINQMTDVLDRLIGLSTLANATFERRHIDMKKLVQTVIDDVSATEPDPAVTFEVGDLPAADADRTLTHVLILNLIGNALKYTRDCGHRYVHVGHDVQGDEVIYFIKDNGIGFDADQAEKIFTAFTRLDENSERDGIGLGLTLAKRVIARHGGRIWAESESGKGATFFFVLSPQESG